MTNPAAVLPQASPTQVAPAQPAAAYDLFEDALGRAGAGRAPASDPAALGERALSALDGFRARAEAIRDETARMTRPDAPAATAPISAIPQEAAVATGAPGGADPMRQMYGLVVRTFDFAMETHLVAKAATQFTGSLNTLLRGQ